MNENSIFLPISGGGRTPYAGSATAIYGLIRLCHPGSQEKGVLCVLILFGD